MRRSWSVIDDPQELQVGIGAGPDLLVGIEQVVGALEREVGRLDRDEEVRRRDERVDGQDAQGRRRVDHDVVVALPDARQLVLEAEVAVELPDQLGLRLGQRDPGAQDVEILVAPVSR